MSEKTPEEVEKAAREARDNRNAERLAKMEAIADKAEQTPEKEDLIDVDEFEAREKAAQKEDEDAQAYARQLQTEGAETEEPQPEEAQDSDTKIVNGETYYRQIVNGKELWKSIKQIRESAQKVDSADEYLKLAKDNVTNASRLALSKKDEPVGLGKDEVRKLLAAVALGDEEAIEKLASHWPEPSEKDVLQKIDQRLSFRTELSRLEDKSRDLLEDPYMGRLFKVRLDELKAEDPTMTIKEAYTSIDQELREKFPGFKGSKLQEKIARKRTLPQPPTASARRVAEAGEESEEPDDSKAIEEMARKRGFIPHVHGPRRQ